ncbi:MAG: hypothetical protein KIT25_01510 [Enhydrobacter sp.]|nr:MAG: hypothetical protein KIT25_01510 [Enhydrobacter sp.]
MARKKKTAKAAAGRAAAGRAAPRAPQVPGRQARRAAPPPLTLRQELLAMAREEVSWLRRALVTVSALFLLALAAAGLWSLRPVPAYSSDDVVTGSPFDVAFRVENTSPWFPLADLRIGCVLAHIRASGTPPTLIDSVDVQFPSGTQRLEPGESAHFRCPFRPLIGHPIVDDAGIVQRAEIYFHSKYDLPLVGTLRLTHNSPHYYLNTRLLPPRWTSRGEEE